MRLAYLLGTLVLVAAVAGCSGHKAAVKAPEAGQDKLTSERDFFIEDVPLPAGFKVQRSKSWGSETPAVRFYRVLAKGSTNVERVAKFYKERKMPLHGWHFVEQNLTPAGMVLEFAKEGEKCRINIDRRVLSTYIRLTLVPTGGQEEE